MKMGSSPRMWGALVKRLGVLWSMRIIPADVGSTEPVSDLVICDEDHPRGCGEHMGLVPH